MNIPHTMLLSTVAEPQGAVGGSDANPFDTTVVSESVVTQPQTGTTQTPTPSSVAPSTGQTQTAAPNAAIPPVVAAPQTALTPAQIADLGASAAARILQAQKTNAPTPPMSQEVFDKTFNVFKTDAAGFKAITGYDAESPAQVAALNSALQGVARQALTMSDALMSQKLDALKAEIMGEFTPVKTFHQTQFQKQLEDEFFTVQPDLKDYRPLIETVIKAEMQAGRKFATKAELFQFAADKTRSLLPATVLQQTGGALVPPTTPQTQQPTTQRRMTPVSTGGQVSATGTGSAAVQNDAKTIFG